MPWAVWTPIACACGTECVTGMNSIVNGPISTDSLSATGRMSQRPSSRGLLDAVPGQTERQLGTVDRQRLVAEMTDAVVVAQQELDAADVVLVPVGRHERDDRVGVVAQVGEVGEHEVDAVHVGIGEHQTAVDQHDRPVVTGPLLDRHAVPADLAETAEEDDANGISHGQPPDWRSTSRARGSTQSGAGPSGSRHSPTAHPSVRSIALVGIGFGCEVAGLEREALQHALVHGAGGRHVAAVPGIEHLDVIATPSSASTTPITPTAPTASSGSVRPSSPE